MIFDIIIGWLISILSGILGLFPSWDFSDALSGDRGTDVLQWAHTGGNYLGAFKNVLDLALLLIVLQALLLLVLVAAVTKVTLWVYAKLPGKAA